jgi:DNA-binding FadR family transcriptional regulator
MSARIRARAEPATLHRRIQRDIERKILSGAWRPGHRIPFEHEIMKQYGCARMTANKALAGLAEAGLVVRGATHLARTPTHHARAPDLPRNRVRPDRALRARTRTRSLAALNPS